MKDPGEVASSPRPASLSSDMEFPVISPSSPGQGAPDMPGQTGQHVLRPGVAAGASLHSARLSANVTEAELAAATDVETATVCSWEDGSQPLASVAMPQFRQLEAALLACGAEPRLVSDLAVAAWCDLVILAIADGCGSCEGRG